MITARYVFLVACFALTSVIGKYELAPKKFLTLPLGEVRPAGWLWDQLQIQTDGVAGHMHEFYELVSNSDWTGGHSYYSYLEEAGSYWFNAMVPNGILMNNSIINEKTEEFLDYVLDHQDSTGWLGPEVGTDKPRYLWGRYPFFFGAIQMVEYKPELTDRVVTALHRFLKLANKMLRDGEGVENWAATRWEDFVMVLQWLYDSHPRGEEEILLDTMKRLKWSGVPWEKVFSREYFPTGPVENLTNPFGIELSWHGVNMAEGLKALPATYRFTHNQSDIDAANLSWDLMFKYHGRPSGAYAADEMLAGLEAVRGTELCLVVEAMFSGSYLYQVIGDIKYADRVERMAYNALPATITADMWGRQYLQQQNQVAAKNMSPNPFPEDGPYSNVFGLEPNYPCCTVNFPQGWPKFITNAFLTTPDRNGLIQLYLGPFEVQTTLFGDNQVKVTVDTLYPFGDMLNITILAVKPFTYYIRVPSWVVGGSMLLDDGQQMELAPDSETGLMQRVVGGGITNIVLYCPAEITIEKRLHSSVAVHRGPLNYAFDIPRSEKIIAQDPHEPHAIDLQIDPVGDWEYAINTDSAKMMFHNDAENTEVEIRSIPTFSESYKLPSPIFDSGKPPVSIIVPACPIKWPLAGDMFVASPPEYPECVGEERNIKLIPFGATRLRISEFPASVLGFNEFTGTSDLWQEVLSV
ncbi:hypothetical protein LENED_000110 [Lentinula edodes]|uniref:Non-reducing end beta-L-arabinofuranosidase-like GH127 catalytic domain-containing protein n=1 Tax=Lentinula edodes TaxID=5353 RepID=A0A1Q3DV08_LENED|nr:hypothetical protein LENED_000110 [Lentinula edodes]